MIVAGMAAGSLLLVVPALAKTKLGVDEVVTTLLFNFVALLFVSTMLDGPMKDPLAMGWPQSAAIPAELEFGKLLERSRVHYLTLDMSPGYGYSGIVIAMLASLNPLGVILASVFVAGLIVGADSMSRAVSVPIYLADVIVAVSLLSMLVAAMDLRDPRRAHVRTRRRAEPRH
jgi:ABC-type uncharacterized transport system permease subunit